MSKISALTEGTSIVATDLFRFVDVSDTTMAASGTNKKATATNVAAGLFALNNLYYGSNIIAQRNGTNPQESRLYNTYDGTNDEWFSVKWDSNTLKLGTYASGTGTVRDLLLGDWAGLDKITLKATTVGIKFEAVGGSSFGLRVDGVSPVFTIGAKLLYLSSYNNFGLPDVGFLAYTGGLQLNDCASGGAFMELIEQTAPSAPAANNVRIYAEDNGAGKTRLMALFPSGAAQQIAIEP